MLLAAGRGLLHAYWAPNVWALYTAADKVLAAVGRRLLPSANIAHAAFTGGLVGDGATHAVLPAVPPAATALLTLAAMAPVLWRTWRAPHPRSFLPALNYCLLCSFMLGWHVHEKALLMVVLPLSLSAAESARDARLFLLMSVVCHFSLFPLLHEPREGPTKLLLLLLHAALSYGALHVVTLWSQRQRGVERTGVRLGPGAWVLFGALCLVYLFEAVVHPLLFREPGSGRLRLPFLPLLLYSVVCAVAMLALWVMLYEQHRRTHQAVLACA